MTQLTPPADLDRFHHREPLRWAFSPVGSHFRVIWSKVKRRAFWMRTSLPNSRSIKLAGRGTVSADGVEVGWIAGDHILDTRWISRKTSSTTCCAAACESTPKSFPAICCAYYMVDLEALSKGNPSGHPSAGQKREARDSARDRLENEAKDGRFRKRKAIEVVWDRQSNEILFGTTR